MKLKSPCMAITQDLLDGGQAKMKMTTQQMDLCDTLTHLHTVEQRGRLIRGVTILVFVTLGICEEQSQQGYIWAITT